MIFLPLAPWNIYTKRKRGVIQFFSFNQLGHMTWSMEDSSKFIYIQALNPKQVQTDSVKHGEIGETSSNGFRESMVKLTRPGPCDSAQY